MRLAVIVPARWGSERLPGKMLADLGGAPLVVRVLERARMARGVERVLVATDDARVHSAVRRAGGEAIMTSPQCASGTDRVAEAARALDVDGVVNLQGDEPFIEPSCIEQVASLLRAGAGMATLWRAGEAGEAQNPNAVKVVTREDGRALYFSRAPIPFARDGRPAPVRVHVGIYGYTKDVLERLSALPPSPLESIERLEQLRALEYGNAGIEIQTAETRYHGFGIDTAEDLERARLLLGGP